MRVRMAVLFALLVSGLWWLDARAQSGGPIVSGAHRFEKIADHNGGPVAWYRLEP